MNHTPGPWKEGSHRSIESKNGTICEIYSHMGIDEADANQRLIAAAPELLAICEELAESAEYWSEYDVPLGIVDRLNATITKATAGQQ